MDSTGLEALQTMHDQLRAVGAQLILAGVSGQPRRLMERANFVTTIGEDSFYPDLRAACQATSTS
jgi:anti-anti-sigma regulatory factor